MGMEIDKLKENNVFVLLDNTSMMVKEFYNLDSLIKACKYFGRNILNFEKQYLLDTFRDEICNTWDDDTEVEKELIKIERLFVQDATGEEVKE